MDNKNFIFGYFNNKHLSQKQIYYNILRKYFILLIVIIACFSCNNSLRKTNDKLVFRYNEHKNIGSLDPAFSKDIADIWGTNQLFNGLVQMDSLMEVVPAIASSWYISENAKTYTFDLRKDVFFHTHYLFGENQTRTVTANDFVYSCFNLSNLLFLCDLIK